MNGSDPRRPQLGAGFPSHPRRLRPPARYRELARCSPTAEHGVRPGIAALTTNCRPAERPKPTFSNIPRFADTATGLGASVQAARPCAPFARRHRSHFSNAQTPSGDHLGGTSRPTQHHRRAPARLPKVMTIGLRPRHLCFSALRKRLRDLNAPRHIPAASSALATNDPKIWRPQIGLQNARILLRRLLALACRRTRRWCGSGGSRPCCARKMWAPTTNPGAHAMGITGSGPPR